MNSGYISLTIIFFLFFVGTGCILWDLITEIHQLSITHIPLQNPISVKPVDNGAKLILDEEFIDSLLSLPKKDIEELESIIIDDLD